jgi:hypothetical protein
MTVRSRVMLGSVVLTVVLIVALGGSDDPKPAPAESDPVGSSNPAKSERAEQDPQRSQVPGKEVQVRKAGPNPDLMLARFEPVRRSMSSLARANGLELPPVNDLPYSKWKSIESLFRSTTKIVEVLSAIRSEMLLEVMEERRSKGQMERVATARLDDLKKLTPGEIRDLDLLAKPRFLGQLVSSSYTDEGHYVCRVNPGDHAGIDSYSDQIRTHVTLMVVGVTQIVESSAEAVSKEDR